MAYIPMRNQKRAPDVLFGGNSGRARSTRFAGRHHTPETRAKMSASRMGNKNSLGYKVPVELVEQRAAQLRGKPRPRHLVELTAAAHRGRKRPMTTRALISARMAQRYSSTERFYSKLEQRAAQMLEPLGFRRYSVRLEHHTFDFAHRRLGVLVEINGCYWHAHQLIQSSCCINPIGPAVVQRDEVFRTLARVHNYRLIELWECEEDAWPLLLVGRAV